MEVDKISFYPLLLDLLTDISEAHFVAFDLELSGVPTKAVNSPYGPGKPSLQSRYLETKNAAERYQILQIGLTCVHQDLERQKYILKPYNFELSPIIEERGIDVERVFSFQSGAVDFLLKVGFDMSVPFYNGIPYLSREETKEAREKFHQRQDRSTFADIQIKPTEVESLAFLERVRSQINDWLKSRNPDASEYVNIAKTSSNDRDPEEPVEGLSRFEKRLVHQLVRSEYPDLVTISKRDFIQIVPFNKAREDKIRADRLRELNERLNKQKGFRWVIEALHGSQITNIDLRECARDPVSGDMIYADMDEFKAQFNRAQALIRGNPRMLIGHNCFLDLVYIYQTFIGPLPDTVEEFQERIHALWPQIADTKYMSTHNCGDINPVSSLEQIASQLSAERTPILEIDKEHMKYAQDESLHEAGYDSFLTAQIALRLSAKLEREGIYRQAAGDSDEKDLSEAVHRIHLTEDIPLSHKASTDGASETAGFVPSKEGGKWKRRGEPTLPAPDPNDPFTYDPKNLHHRHQSAEAEETFEGGMPARNSEFWRVYGNRLRVFGTEEGMCVLDGSDKKITDDGSNGSGGVSVKEL